MLILDVLIRYSAVTVLLLTVILAFRDGRKLKPTLYIILVCATVAFMLLTTVPEALKLPAPLHNTLRVLDVGNIVFIWWLGLALFQDGFRLKWWHWLVFIINAVILIPNRLSEINGKTNFPILANYGLDLLTVIIMGHLVYVTLKGRADDLIEPRRKGRLYFVLAMIASTLLAVFTENMLSENHFELLQTVRGLIILPIALWALLWLTQLHPERIVFEETIKPAPAKPAIDPRDEMLLSALTAAMEQDKRFKEPGLTIRSLSEQLSTPEHRLRALINQGLGYRNFSGFLNHYRLSAIKKTFADPEYSRTPVLTIALDHGYNSLAPFNRAFRESEKMTPSQYRQTLHANPD